MDFGTRLREMLEARGISQNKFADSMGIDRSQLSKIINGKATVTMQMLDRMAEGLGISKVAFFEEESANKELLELILNELPPDLIEFIKAQKNQPWIVTMKDVSEMNVTPEQVVRIVKLWKDTVEKSIK